MLTEKEKNLNELLGACFVEFCMLPVLHAQDKIEFMRAIHAAQNIVLSRPALREMGFAVLEPALEERKES
jgi:hypothetical protein